MRRLVINLEKATYERLRARAKLHGLSLEDEVRDILTRSVNPDRRELVRLADAIRAKTQERDRGSVVREIREDRDGTS